MKMLTRLNVADVMTKHLFTIPDNATLIDASQLMARKKISSVIITKKLIKNTC